MALTMKKKNGFTLIELLVVIAIIALLLSIIMPALGKVKAQARSLVCKANLRSLVLGMKLYAEENDGKSMEMQFGLVGEYWFDQLMPYLGQASGQYDVKEQLQVGFCPSTKRPDSPATTHAKGTAKQAWRWIMSSGADWKVSEGSYGLNHWLIPRYYGIDTKDNWSNQYTTIPGSVPVLGDCNWVGGWPMETDEAPKTGETVNYMLSDGKDPFVGEDQLGRYCLDRHDMKVNMAFVGGNVEAVPLEKLWSFRWHKNFAPVDVTITK